MKTENQLIYETYEDNKELTYDMLEKNEFYILTDTKTVSKLYKDNENEEWRKGTFHEIMYQEGMGTFWVKPGDLIFQLLTHWKLESVDIFGFVENRAQANVKYINPKPKDMYITVGLSEVLKRNDYPKDDPERDNLIKSGTHPEYYNTYLHIRNDTRKNHVFLTDKMKFKLATLDNVNMAVALF